MAPALVDLYDAVAPRLTPALAGAAVAATLREILAAIPDHAETFGFEVRLDAEDERVDLGTAWSAHAGGARALAGADDPALARLAALDERWQRLRDFGRRWADDPEVRLRVPFVFLEYDCDGPRRPVPVPSVFLGLDWPVAELTAEARRAGRAEAMQAPGLAQALEWLAVFRREPLTAAERELLSRCWAGVPDGGLVLHLAIMLARPRQAVRASLLLPRAAAVPFLAELGLAGAAGLERVFDAFAPVTDFGQGAAPVQVDVDLGETLGAAIGLMLQPGRGDSWPHLLAMLVAAGLCDPARGEAVLRWQGGEVARVGRCEYRLQREIAHAKITWGAAIAPRAKAYVGLRWSPVS